MNNTEWYEIKRRKEYGVSFSHKNYLITTIDVDYGKISKLKCGVSLNIVGSLQANAFLYFNLPDLGSKKIPLQK